MSVQRLKREDCMLLIIDVQEAFVPSLHEPYPVIKNIVKLVNGADVLGIPIILTEQYPKGIGETVPHILDRIGSHSYVEKDTFSCFKEPRFVEQLSETGKSQIILTGIEAHVCVTKTALDAIDAGFEVYVVDDAVTSRTKRNRDLGVRRMERAGAIVESTESALFACIERSDDETFKQIHRIIK
jgi:nicotinamidase-related amidase